MRRVGDHAKRGQRVAVELVECVGPAQADPPWQNGGKVPRYRAAGGAGLRARTCFEESTATACRPPHGPAAAGRRARRVTRQSSGRQPRAGTASRVADSEIAVEIRTSSNEKPRPRFTLHLNGASGCASSATSPRSTPGASRGWPPTSGRTETVMTRVLSGSLPSGTTDQRRTKAAPARGLHRRASCHRQRRSPCIRPCCRRLTTRAKSAGPVTGSPHRIDGNSWCCRPNGQTGLVDTPLERRELFQLLLREPDRGGLGARGRHRSRGPRQQAATPVVTVTRIAVATSASRA